MQSQMAVDIKAPPEKVWPYLVEPDKTMQWYTMLKKFEYTNARAGAGLHLLLGGRCSRQDLLEPLPNHRMGGESGLRLRDDLGQLLQGLHRALGDQADCHGLPVLVRRQDWSSPTDPSGRSWAGSVNAWPRSRARRSFRISSVWPRRSPGTAESRVCSASSVRLRRHRTYADATADLRLAWPASTCREP